MLFSYPEYSNVYELLDEVRRRPGMFLGGARIDLLQAFTTGACFAGLDDGDPPLSGFVSWVSLAFGDIPDNSSFPFHPLIEKFGEEGALSEYFRRLDKYRESQLRVAERCGSPTSAKFQYVDTQGVKTAPPLPVAVELVEFLPSGVWCLREIYEGARTELVEWSGSLAGIRKNLRSRWNLGTDA